MIFISIVFVSLFYAICGLLWPKKELTLDINKRTHFVIKQGDIMKENGMRIIPVNEYFDTHLGDGIINENSLHWKKRSMLLQGLG